VHVIERGKAELMSTADQSPDPEPQLKPKKELLPGLNQLYRDFAPYLTLGMQLAAAVLMFFFMGWWVDGKLSTTPVFQLVGILLGFIGGMVKFLRTVSGLNKQKKSNSA